jgi:Cell division protein FtsI/penicillin-binding protein 2
MNRIAKRANYLILLFIFFLVCGAIFVNDYRLNVKKWVLHPSNQNIYLNGELTTPGTVYSSDGFLLLQIDSQGINYANDPIVRLSTLHVIGDRNDNITTGVLYSKKSKLIGYDLLNGVFNQNLNENNQLNLTINAKISTIAYNALGDFNGAVGIYNYETGEIITMVSKPSFDPMNYIPDISNEAYEGVFINRVTNGIYVPGSIMKLITAYAAIENIDDIYLQSFNCEHGIYIDEEWIQCHDNHGIIDFETALSVSCNSAFAIISNQIGSDILMKYASKAGINTSYSFNNINTTRGFFNVSNSSNVELAWAGIGQYTTMVNPMQFMLFVGSIANNGILVNPYYIEENRFFNFGNSNERIISKDSATTLSKLMRNNTISNYGDYRFLNMELSAKTGTAEVEDGSPHSWFVGFLANSDTPLAFVIIVENGGNSNTEAINVAETVLHEAIEIFD